MERKSTWMSSEDVQDRGSYNGSATLPNGVVVLRDFPYGYDKNQPFDSCTPTKVKDVPVIFMVHGSAWCFVDKALRSVVENKFATWVPRGFIFISINCRILPEFDAFKQSDDVALALAKAQKNDKSGGDDPAKFIVYRIFSTFF